MTFQEQQDLLLKNYLFRYDKDENSAIIKNGFRSYRRAVNPVYQARFKESVEELVKMHSSDPVKFNNLNKDFLEVIAAPTDEARKA